MPKRRGDGEGSIYQAKDGRWRAEVSLGYKPDGKPRRKILYGRTRVEVADALKKTLRDQQLGMNVKPERQTVAALLQSWLEGTVKPKNRPQTYRSYEWLIRVHLTPGLGKLTLDNLTPQRVQEFVAERYASGSSAGTVKHIRATLRAALSHAERWGLVHRNAAKLVVVPSGDRYKPTVLGHEQAKDLLKAAAASNHGALLTTAITLGLRRGELLALRWSDIDLDHCSIRVRHSLERIKGAGLQLTKPKSEKSKRELRLPLITVQALLEQKERQRVAREWAGSAWKAGDFVFTTSVGTPMIPESVNSALKTALAAAKLPRIRFHDLRHTSASLLLSLGVHPKLVQEQLGHSTFQLTMDTYSHVIPSLRNEIADRIDSVFGSTPTKAPTTQVSALVN